MQASEVLDFLGGDGVFLVSKFAVHLCDLAQQIFHQFELKALGQPCINIIVTAEDLSQYALVLFDAIVIQLRLI